MPRKLKKTYRPGGVGAMMDEYERAADEFKNLIKKITLKEFEKIVDTDTLDDDCRSVQTIVSHVINSGYGYADYLRNYFSIPSTRPERKLLSKKEFFEQLSAMLVYTSDTLEGKWQLTDEEIQKAEIKVRWGSVYDIEQIIEHAIVHILRHRRQVEKFAGKGKLKIKE